MSKVIKTACKSFEEVDRQLLELGRIESFIAKKEAEMNLKIQQTKERYEEETKDVRQAKVEIEKDIESFCVLNKAEFIKHRTKSLANGVIGFRTNPPKVSLLNRKYNLNTVVELVKRIFPGKYIRTKEELNKDEILLDMASEKLNDEKLAGIGLKIDQDETVVIDINWEELKSQVVLGSITSAK